MFKQDDSSSRQKIDGYFFQQILRENVRLCLNTEKRFLVEVSFYSQRPYVPLNNGARDF